YHNAATGREYQGRTGTLSIPKELEGIVMAVLGFDARPVANTHFRLRQTGATSYTPPQIAAMYNFPTTGNGSGQTVAIIELGGGDYRCRARQHAEAFGYLNQLGRT